MLQTNVSGMGQRALSVFVQKAHGLAVVDTIVVKITLSTGC